MDKREKTARQREEDAALEKILYWIGGTALLVVLLRAVRGYYTLLPLLGAAGVVLAAAALYLARRARQAGKDTVFPSALGVFFLGLAACTLGIWCLGGVPGSIQLSMYVVIGLCVLAVIYYLYQRDFAAVALVSALGLLGLWLIFLEGSGVRLYLAVAFLLILVAAVAVLTRYLQRRGGTLTLKGRRVELLPKSGAYHLIYVTCALVAVLLGAALTLGGVPNPMLYYAVPVAWFLIMAVYYTVKLM